MMLGVTQNACKKFSEMPSKSNPRVLYRACFKLMLILAFVVLLPLVSGTEAQGGAAPTVTAIKLGAAPVNDDLTVVDGAVVGIQGIVSLQSDNSAVTTGTVEIQRRNLDVACGDPGVSFPDSAGSGAPPFTANYNTAGQGGNTQGFRARFGGVPSQLAISESPCVDLIIQEQTGPGVCDGLDPNVYIRAIAAAGQGIVEPGDTGPWSYVMEVKNCTGMTLYPVKVQGGTSGWTQFVDSDPLALENQVGKGNKKVKSNSSNVVLTWLISLADEEVKQIQVNVNGIVPSAQDGDWLFLSGNWSAAFNDGDSTNDEEPGKSDYPDKSAYTGRVALCVDATGGLVPSVCDGFDPIVD